MFSSWHLISFIVIFITNGNLGMSFDAYPDGVNLPEFQRRSSEPPSESENEKHERSKSDDEGDDEGDDETQEPSGSSSRVVDHPHPQRTIISDMDDKNIVQKVIIAYGAAVATVLGASANPAVAVGGAVVPYFTDVLVSLVKDEEESNVWNQIEERVNEQIASALSEWHFGVLLTPIKKLQQLMTRNNLTKQDLDFEVLPVKEQFLPQTFERVGFRVEWATALPAYVTYMTAVYLQLIENGAIDNCSLAKQLEEIRGDAIQAARALFRARFRGLIGIKHFKESPKGCRGVLCYLASWLTFKDEAADKERTALLTDVRRKIFNKVEDETTKLLWENMIVRLNAFYSSSLCLCEKGCPGPIRKDEITFHYPTKCYGEPLKQGKTCKLPCHSYDFGKTWCVTDMPSEHNNILGNGYEDCKRERSLTKCFPVKAPKSFPEQ